VVGVRSAWPSPAANDLHVKGYVQDKADNATGLTSGRSQTKSVACVSMTFHDYLAFGELMFAF